MPDTLIAPTRRAAGRRGTDRRLQIVEAAVRRFGAMPYVEVHMDAVAADARVAKPTLYRYFPTKEALFIEGLAWEFAALRDEIGATRAVAPVPRADERLRRAIAAVLRRIGRLSPALQAVEVRSGELGERSRQVLRAGFAALKAEIGLILRDGARDGDLVGVDVDLAVLVILGGVRMAAVSGRGAPVDPDALADLLLHGLRPAVRPGPARASSPLPAHSSLPNQDTVGTRRSPLGAVA